MHGPRTKIIMRMGCHVNPALETPSSAIVSVALPIVPPWIRCIFGASNLKHRFFYVKNQNAALCLHTRQNPVKK